ncbi:cytochrome d ubiquinol oxidase subunit II [Minwuia thermotolerans]|uniref:Cytochrome d ubiquinol oxidase subunit II n=1 Tax=Minwuia thermotolerans TaxID=2056226 RepID=A0A2M9FXP8_9PROT|nr:cytochrome d ubiquinol oxidase subunit II [Minwuia thermotolerans]PJK28236.1 cytochrome d ubiquinol oxidase subunit II [Minwuia thermotolerans]
MPELAYVWACLIALSVLLYVALDGFDLGIGILFPMLKDDARRDVAMNSVAPVWDGNETWLVLGGGGLFAVFPLAYAVIMPALYIPVIVMLVALIFRGVAFEFRWKSERRRWLWDASFFGGSLVAALAQGVTLGALVQGIAVENRAYAGGPFDWLTPFSLFTGAALIAGYALLGATWLIMKTEGGLRRQATDFAWAAGVTTYVLVGAVSLWTPFLDPLYFQRWFSTPVIWFAWPVPLLVAATAAIMVRGLLRGGDRAPFLAAQGLFALCFVGLGISFWPMMIPPEITIVEAAAPRSTLIFMLVGAGILLPIILAYTVHAYWVFRGKVREGEGYH